MGVLIDGVWQEQQPEAAKPDAKASGRFERVQTAFRNWVTPDGRPGPTGSDGFAAMAGRYHLYVSLACPWAHRTLIMRALKGLEDAITVDVVHPLMAENGWTFDTGFPGATGDRLGGKSFLYEVYRAAKPDYSGRVSVP